MVEHGTENAGVDSSILSLGTSNLNLLFLLRASFVSPLTAYVSALVLETLAKPSPAFSLAPLCDWKSILP